MEPTERRFISLILITIAAMVALDLATDVGEGVKLWHVLAEGFTGGAALVAFFLVMRGSLRLKSELEQERRDFSAFRAEAEQWKAESRKHLVGLSQAIDTQLQQWELTAAEKEVAFLLLKGLSLKEIAEARRTSEKTSRAQSQAVYSKSGLSGRSELAAFFLGDLVSPDSASVRE